MEKNSHIDWSDMPLHKPNGDLWERIETELDIQPITGNLDELPVHNPKHALWNSINTKLYIYKYAGYALYTGIALTIVILLFVFIDKPATIQDKKHTEAIKINENTVNNAVAVNAANTELKTVNTESENEVFSEKLVKPKTPLDKKQLVSQSYIPTKKAENKIVKTDFSKHETAYPNPSVQIDKLSIEKQSDANILSTPNLTLKGNIITAPAKERVSTTIDNKAKPIEINPFPQQADVKTEVKPSTTDEKTAKDEEAVLRTKLKSASIESEKGLYSIGIDYTFNKIYNAENFSYSANNQLSQFGINVKYNYRKWIIQSGLNLSSFSDNFNYNSDQQLNQFKTYHYVDSVVYNPQGNIIQYITHPVTVNDSVLYQQLLDVSRKYTMLNIPIVVGYQLNYSKFSFALKAGVLCSVIISEKESIKLPDKPDVSIIKIYSANNSVNKVNWGTIIAAEFDYNFTKRLGFSAEPVLQYYFKSLYKEMDINSVSNTQKPYLLGVKFGLYYKF